MRGLDRHKYKSNLINSSTMKNLEFKYNEIKAFCEKNANQENVKRYARYFTEGYDAYGVDTKIFLKQKDHWLKAWQEELTLDDYLALGDLLVSEGKYELISMAIQLVAEYNKDYTAETLPRFGNWLESGINNWAGTDVLCSYVLAHFWEAKIVEVEVLTDWITSPSKWKRRAVPVTLINALKSGVELNRLLAIIDPLMMDPEKFVQKGLGWFLREAWKKFPEQTETFLLKWKDTCGRTIIQYATEKMAKEERLRFRRVKKI